MIIRKVGVLSAGKISAALNGVFGLIIGVVVSIISVFGAAFARASGDQAAGPLAGMLLGVGAFIFFPLLYGLMGFVGGAVSALIYNVASGFVGGLEIEVEATAPEGATPTSSA